MFLRIFSLRTIITKLLCSLALPLSIGTYAIVPDRAIEEIIVSAEFRDSELLALSNSVTVLNQTSIKKNGAQHIETLLGIAPNVNYSSGASRGRFFQIRGIGERSQFVNPINPSIGLIIDGIDFTGLGLSASTIDIQQIEILRGPQGTLHGANALGGLINFTSNTPTKEYSGNINTQFSNYDGRSLDAVFSGPINNNIGFRIAGRINQQDGYVENNFLNRDDTNNIDEVVLKGAINSKINENLNIKFNAFLTDIDNGYDAFSLNNNRITTSDQPGSDSQETLAASFTAVWAASQSFDLETVISGADTDTLYSYDEDWSYVGEFDPNTGPYSSADRYVRDRNSHSIDIRLISKADQKIMGGRSDWILGVYQRSEKESLERSRSEDLLPEIGGDFTNQTNTDNYSIYGQLTTALGNSWNLITGLRLEHRDADYTDSTNIKEEKSETFFGGRFAIEYQINSDSLFYGLVSRGFKGDGVNAQIISAAQLNSNISENTFFFDAETLINYELGAKLRLLDNTLQIQTAIFYQDRKNAQVKQSIFNSDDFSFDDYLDNTKAYSLGLEFESIYLASDELSFYVSLGYLDTKLIDFSSSSHVDARFLYNGSSVSLDGREVAHAPNYQFAIGGKYQLSPHWSASVDLEGKDDFYFSNSHNEKSDRYELLHAQLSYTKNQISISLWGRNLTNEEVETRGFYFAHDYGNNPSNGYAPEAYKQFGEPRLIGVSATYEW